MMLGALGTSYELCGQQLFPIGTVYDPFVCRGLDALIYDLYNQSKMIVVGTPSGITLSPEGGAHQSTITPSIGIELPNLIFYEPAFGKEVEWTLLEALRQIADRRHGKSTYLRLTTKTVDQALIDPAHPAARRGDAAAPGAGRRLPSGRPPPRRPRPATSATPSRSSRPAR